MVLMGIWWYNLSFIHSCYALGRCCILLHDVWLPILILGLLSLLHILSFNLLLRIDLLGLVILCDFKSIVGMRAWRSLSIHLLRLHHGLVLRL